MTLSSKIFLLVLVVSHSFWAEAQSESNLKFLINDKAYEEYHGFHRDVLTKGDTIYVKLNNNSKNLKLQFDSIFVYLNFNENIGAVSRGLELFDNSILIIPAKDPSKAPIVRIAVAKYMTPVYKNFSNAELSKMTKELRGWFKLSCDEGGQVARLKVYIKGFFEINTGNRNRSYHKVDEAFKFICSE